MLPRYLLSWDVGKFIQWTERQLEKTNVGGLRSPREAWEQENKLVGGTLSSKMSKHLHAVVICRATVLSAEGPQQF